MNSMWHKVNFSGEYVFTQTLHPEEDGMQGES